MLSFIVVVTGSVFVTTQTKEDGTQDYISKTQKVELGKVISVILISNCSLLSDFQSSNVSVFGVVLSFIVVVTGSVFVTTFS